MNKKTETHSNDSESALSRHRKPVQLSFPLTLEELGGAANQAASRHVFEEYQQRCSPHTLRRQKADLDLFSTFIEGFGFTPGDFFNQPSAWKEVTWGLVAAYVQWQLQQGYAVNSVNIRLSTVKTYAKLAHQSGDLGFEEYARIKNIKSYAHKQAVQMDKKREITRIGPKKADPIPISREQARQLKAQPDTPQGRRDAIIMCLLLDHGLRVGELALLNVEMFNLESGLLEFYRPKVSKKQKHLLSQDTYRALVSYQPDMPASGPLLRRSKNNGKLGAPGMTDRAITQRVNFLGKMVDPPLFGLSAHDCRHYWATAAAKSGTDPFVLQEAGGWSSLAMPRRYIEENEIANQGLLLDGSEDDTIIARD